MLECAWVKLVSQDRLKHKVLMGAFVLFSYVAVENKVKHYGGVSWGTYDDVVLAQHWHLPQGLVSEAVEIIRTVLPLGPAPPPARLQQLIYT